MPAPRATACAAYLRPTVKSQPLVDLWESQVVAHRQAQPASWAVARRKPVACGGKPARHRGHAPWEQAGVRLLAKRRSTVSVRPALPGGAHLDSMSTGPPGTSTLNRWTFLQASSMAAHRAVSSSPTACLDPVYDMLCYAMLCRMLSCSLNFFRKGLATKHASPC